MAILLLLLERFTHKSQLMVFHWSLGDRKSPQVSRNLLSILADLNNAVVGMVFTRPLISEYSRPLINPLLTVPRAPITIGINFTFMFYRYFNSLARSRYLSFDSLSFNFTLWSDVTIMTLKFLAIPRSPFLKRIRLQSFAHFPIAFCLRTELHNRICMSANFLSSLLPKVFCRGLLLFCFFVYLIFLFFIFNTVTFSFRLKLS